MFVVKKDGRTMKIPHKAQLDAFLADGWEEVKPSTKEKQDPEEDYELPRTRSTTRRRTNSNEE